MYPKLYGRLAEARVSQKELAEKINMSPSALSEKLRGKRDFAVNEVRTIAEALSIPAEEVGNFFKVGVSNETKEHN